MSCLSTNRKISTSHVTDVWWTSAQTWCAWCTTSKMLSSFFYVDIQCLIMMSRSSTTTCSRTKKSSHDNHMLSQPPSNPSKAWLVWTPIVKLRTSSNQLQDSSGWSNFWVLIATETTLDDPRHAQASSLCVFISSRRTHKRPAIMRQYKNIATFIGCMPYLMDFWRYVVGRRRARLHQLNSWELPFISCQRLLLKMW